MQVQKAVTVDYSDDVALAGGLADRNPTAVRLITERNNQRLFRAAWGILRNRAEAEDAVQSGYLRAFAAAGTFEGRSSLATWLTRIVINEALVRKRAIQRRMRRLDANSVTVLEDYREKMMRGSSSTLPDGSLATRQIGERLEQAIGKLPEKFRIVFILREIEGMSVEQVAELLDIQPETVKTRALRARRRLQAELEADMKSALLGTFPFAGHDCAAMTERVLSQLCGSN